jgi:hypothetical protein
VAGTGFVLFVQQAFHDFSQVTSSGDSELFQRKLFNVDILTFKKGLELVAHRGWGKPRELYNVIEEGFPFLQLASFRRLFFQVWLAETEVMLTHESFGSRASSGP